MKTLKDKVCLVTGGSRGIGRAAAIALAEAGGIIAINYQHSEDASSELCEEIRAMKKKASCYRANVAVEEETAAMIDAIRKDHGPIQVLVNNAGITRDKSFVRMTRDMWDEVLGVNLNGPFNVTKAVLPDMIEAKWGRVINIASIVGQTGAFGQANYSVTKGGLIAFTMTLAREVARKGITVNAVAPGYIETDMLRDVPEPVIENIKALNPMGRLGKPEEIAAAIAFLASDASSYITGQVLPVNGGMYM